jgi:hypothetical protein
MGGARKRRSKVVRIAWTTDLHLKYVEVEQPAPPKPRLFADVPADDLLSNGVPVEWLVLPVSILGGVAARW